MLKEGKQTIFYVFNRLNWKLVSAHNPAIQKCKTEPEAPWSHDLLWNVVVTTERESGALLFMESHLPSQVLAANVGASKGYCIFLQPALVRIAL